jgi:hypothetical protein
MASRFAGRISKDLVFVLVAVATFDVPASLVITRGHSPWVALIVGLTASPIVPVAWHVVGERRRRRASAKATTTGWQRLRYRTLVIAVVTCAMVLATARTHLWEALHDHFLWFLPDRTVWFAGDPPAVGSRAMCEAVSTMDIKCDAGYDAGDYTLLVTLCQTITADNQRDERRGVTVHLVPTIEDAERCAVKTSACDDYEACVAEIVPIRVEH